METSPHIERYSDEDLPDALRRQVLDGMRAEWPWAFTEAHSLRPDNYPPGATVTHFAIVDGSRLVGYATVVRLSLTHGGERFVVDGLGNVRVAPEARGQGLGAAIVAAATAFIARGDADVAALFCSPDRVSFYRRAGWEVIDGGTLRGDPAHPEPYRITRMMLLLSERGRAARGDFSGERWFVGSSW